MVDLFRVYVVQNPELRTPIMTIGGTTFLWVRHLDLCIVAAVMSNTNPTMVYEFLFCFISVCNSYIGELNEENVKKNFILIYEVLDEMMDFGFPQNSDINALKMYVVSESLHGMVPARQNVGRPTMDLPSEIGWRQPDIKYRKNQCFVDVLEMIHLTISSQGTVVRADVDGVIKMRALLSGMPECIMSLNSNVAPKSSMHNIPLSVQLSDCVFHPCIQFVSSNGDPCLRFIPPDGEFELLRYRAKKNVRLPLRIYAVFERKNASTVQYQVVLRTNLDQQMKVSTVIVRIPTPHHATSVTCNVRMGKAKWDSNEHLIIWRIPKVQGMTESVFLADVFWKFQAGMQWQKPPIQVDFEVPSLTASGLAVRYLQITERSNYSAVKWVRYETQARNSFLVYV